MRVKIVQIGNSKGLRIPKSILDDYGPVTELEMVKKGKQLILTPVEDSPRADWSQQFASAGLAHSEDYLEGMEANNFDRKEWVWK